jgi:hypothetical protein
VRVASGVVVRALPEARAGPRAAVVVVVRGERRGGLGGLPRHRVKYVFVVAEHDERTGRARREKRPTAMT